MATTGRHRAPSSVVWLPVIVSALLGVLLGSWVTAAAGGSEAKPITYETTAPSPVPGPASTTANPVTSIGFAEPAVGPAGLSVTVLPPEKVKGGVRFTIALVNGTAAPITVNTGELGPNAPRFDGATVPMTMTPANKKLMPGEGYTYQCMLRLPTTDVGQLSFTLGTLTVTGRTAGD
ncbi:MAG: hypothetical protein ACRDTC_21130 [Pseudonocardiaceae bacterium]